MAEKWTTIFSEKVNIIEAVSVGRSQVDVAVEFNIATSTLSTILKEKDTI